MSSNDRTSESSEGSTSGDRRSTDGSVASAESDASTEPDTSTEPDAPAEPSVPEGFGEPSPDREASRWGGYALAALLAVVFLVGLVRVTYPNLSILVIGTLLALFGLLVGLLAVRGRIWGS